MKRPLLPVALCYAGGLLLAEYLQPPVLLLFLGAFALWLGALCSARARGFLLWPLLVLVGWTNLVSRTAVISPHDLRVIAGTEPALVTVRGRLEDTPDVRVSGFGELEFTRAIARLHVHALSERGQWQPAHGHVMVSTKGELPPEFHTGREIEVTGVLAPPPQPVAPGLFDYRAFLERKGIHFQLKADSLRDWQIVDGKTTTPPFTDRFLTWAQSTLARGLPEHDEPLRLMWAMTLGWKTALTDEVNEPFMKSGTLHIFAISGLHIAMIAGILVALLRVLRVPRMACGAVVIPLLWFYTAATGWQPSAVRATIMMTVVVGGWSLRRPSDLLNSLAAAAFVILLWEPQQLFQASFQLSFFVVLSIALFMPPLEKWSHRLLAADPLLAPEVMTRWQRAWRTGARWLTANFVISLAAWLGSLPLTMYYFHLFTPVALLANLVIVPLAGLALMCNLGSLMCSGWFPWATELFNHAGWLWMTWMTQLSRWSTELPGAYFYAPAPSAFTFIVYFGLLIGAMNGWLWQPKRRWRTVAALLIVAGVYGWNWHNRRGNIELTLLPHNGGHGHYLDAPGRAGDWLIDCGNTNSVEFVTKPFLHARGVNRLPRLMLTHGDLKHIGGAENLMAEFRTREVYASSFRFRSVAYRRLYETLQSEPYRLTTVHRGDQVGPWRVLHPTTDDRDSQADNGALVLHADFHGTRVLLLSDLGRTGQELLLDRTPDLRADIVVSGLPTQSEPLRDVLLDAIQPRVIIIADTGYPATERAKTELKERLTRRNVPVIYMREAGAVTMRFHQAGCDLKPAAGEVVSLTAQ